MIYRILALTAWLAASTLANAEHRLVVEDPWSPQAPPGRMMAGFMVIENPGDDLLSLVGGESDRFGRIEIHTMSMDDGVMRMRRLDSLDIAAGESVTLRPGGLHLMLMQPRGQFEVGDQFDIELIDAEGSRWPITLQVRERRRRPQP